MAFYSFSSKATVTFAGVDVPFFCACTSTQNISIGISSKMSFFIEI
jgi:hypothetical protein